MTKLAPADDAFLQAADHRVEVSATFRATPAELWAAFADHANWHLWYPDMTDCTTTDAGGGVGAERSVKLGPLRAEERWVIWEPPTRLGFTVTKMNLPMARRVLEVIEIEPQSSGPQSRTVVHFTGCYQPHPLSRLTFSRTMKNIRRSWTTALASLAVHVEATTDQTQRLTPLRTSTERHHERP